MPKRMRRLLVRLTQPSFTVSVGAVVFDKQDRVLLLNHVLRPASGWGIGGGFLDSGEQPQAAIKRELCEEVGVEIENLQFVQVWTIGNHVEIIYRADAKTEVVAPQSKEILEARWFSLNELPPEMSNSQLRLIKLAREVREKTPV